MRPIKSVLRVSSVLRIRRVSREWRLLEPTVGLL